MRHLLRFRAGDDGRVLLEELTLAYGLALGSGYERGAAALGVPAGRAVRVELLDEAGRLLDWRTYRVPLTTEEVPARVAYRVAWPGRSATPRPHRQARSSARSTTSVWFRPVTRNTGGRRGW